MDHGDRARCDRVRRCIECSPGRGAHHHHHDTNTATTTTTLVGTVEPPWPDSASKCTRNPAEDAAVSGSCTCRISERRSTSARMLNSPSSERRVASLMAHSRATRRLGRRVRDRGSRSGERHPSTARGAPGCRWIGSAGHAGRLARDGWGSGHVGFPARSPDRIRRRTRPLRLLRSRASSRPRQESAESGGPFPGFLRYLLSAHLDQQVPDETDAMPFTSPLGPPRRNRNFGRRVWSTAVERAGQRQGLEIHDPRHTLRQPAHRHRRQPQSRSGAPRHPSISVATAPCPADQFCKRSPQPRSLYGARWREWRTWN